MSSGINLYIITFRLESSTRPVTKVYQKLVLLHHSLRGMGMKILLYTNGKKETEVFKIMENSDSGYPYGHFSVWIANQRERMATITSLLSAVAQ